MQQNLEWLKHERDETSPEGLRAEIEYLRLKHATAMARKDGELARLRAEVECLQIIKQRFEAIVNNVPSWLFACNSRGDVVFMNDGFTLFTGRPASEALGNGWLKFVHPDDAEAVRQALGTALTTGVSRGVEMRVRSKSGTYRRHLASGTAVRDAHGKIIEWYGSLAPIEISAPSD